MGTNDVNSYWAKNNWRQIGYHEDAIPENQGKSITNAPEILHDIMLDNRGYNTKPSDAVIRRNVNVGRVATGKQAITKRIRDGYFKWPKSNSDYINNQIDEFNKDYPNDMTNRPMPFGDDPERQRVLASDDDNAVDDYEDFAYKNPNYYNIGYKERDYYRGRY